MELRRELGLTDLVLFNIVAIVGLRWIATAAQTGPSSILLWILALVFFFLPQAFAVSMLSARDPSEGGLYVWTREAFGTSHGFMSGWCYWTNNIVYYPSLILYLAGIATYIGGDATAHLGENKVYVTLFSLACLWTAIGMNVVGLRIGKWLQNVGGVGTWIPGVLLIVLGFVAWARYGPETSFGDGAWIPGGGGFTAIAFWSTMCFAFAGLELAPVLGGEIKDPKRTIPRAIFVSGISITSIYVLGTIAVLMAVPAGEVNVVTGVVQAISAVGERAGVGALASLSALLIVLGGLGGAGAWLAGSARIPFVIGLDKYLPEAFGRVHPRWGTPHVAIIVQGVLATVFLVMSLIGAEIEEAYIVLLDTTILVYFIPFLYLFASLPRLVKNSAKAKLAGLAGFVTTGTAMALAIVPPDGISNPLVFEVKVVGGMLGFLLVGAILYRRGRKAQVAGNSE